MIGEIVKLENMMNKYKFGMSGTLGGIINTIHDDIEWDQIEIEYQNRTDADRINCLSPIEKYQLANSHPVTFEVEAESKDKSLHYYAEDNVISQP